MTTDYSHITKELKNQTHFLTNLCSIVGRNNLIFYAEGYYFRIHYVDGNFFEINAYTPLQWELVMLQQEPWDDLDQYLKNIAELPIDFEVFKEHLKTSKRLMDTLRQNPDQVLCLTDYPPHFYTIFIPHSGFYFLSKSSLTEQSIPHLGYYTDKLPIDFHTETYMLQFILKDVMKNPPLQFKTLSDAEKNQSAVIRQKITALKLKGIHFSPNRAYSCQRSKHEQLTIVFSTDNSIYFVIENTERSSVIIDRIPNQFGILALFELVKRIPVLSAENNSPWINQVQPQEIVELTTNLADHTLYFGPNTDTYRLRAPGEIWHRYGSEPIDFKRYSHFIDPCDWYFHLEYVVSTP